MPRELLALGVTLWMAQLFLIAVGFTLWLTGKLSAANKDDLNPSMQRADAPPREPWSFVRVRASRR
jgi:hypothetical protein